MIRGDEAPEGWRAPAAILRNVSWPRIGVVRWMEGSAAETSAYVRLRPDLDTVRLTEVVELGSCHYLSPCWESMRLEVEADLRFGDVGVVPLRGSTKFKKSSTSLGLSLTLPNSTLPQLGIEQPDGVWAVLNIFARMDGTLTSATLELVPTPDAPGAQHRRAVARLHFK